MIWIFSILGDRAANVDITWYHWPCNIDITKNRFYMAARIDKIVISELAATDRRKWLNRYRRASSPMAFIGHYLAKNHPTKNPIKQKYSPRSRAPS